MLQSILAMCRLISAPSRSARAAAVAYRIEAQGAFDRSVTIVTIASIANAAKANAAMTTITTQPIGPAA